MVLAALLGLTVVACGDDDDGAPAVPDSGVMAPAGSCAQPGDVGNELGIGTFCSPRGGQCAAFPQAGVCLATIAPGEGQWFCTRLCSDDADCGSDAVCTGDGRGAACVPARCAPEPEDGGVGVEDDAGLDAGIDRDAGEGDAGEGDA